MDQRQDISLNLVRSIKTTPEKVFAAWTKPENLKRWMAPGDDMSVALAETDLRVGGRYRIVMRETNGTEHRVGGIYREIVPSKKLSFTWAWESTPENESLVTIELRKNGTGTELKLAHTKFATDQAREMHNQGWNGCLAKLERLMAA